MMTDRESMELAAKAAGVKGRYVQITATYGEIHVDEGWTHHAFNPKHSDGDSFRLAATLEFDIMHRVVGGRRIEVLAAGGPLLKHFYEGETADAISAAMREAVLLTAAEIGKAMP